MFLNPYLFKRIDDVTLVGKGFRNTIYKKKIIREFLMRLLVDDMIVNGLPTLLNK